LLRNLLRGDRVLREPGNGSGLPIRRAGRAGRPHAVLCSSYLTPLQC
jgi:hypothetical protein